MYSQYWQRIIYVLIFLLAVNVSLAQQNEKGIPDGFKEVSWQEISRAIDYNWDQKTGILSTAGAYTSCAKDFHKIPIPRNAKETAWFNTSGNKQVEALALADGYLKEDFLPSLLRNGSSWVRGDSVRVYQFFKGKIYCKRLKK